MSDNPVFLLRVVEGPRKGAAFPVTVGATTVGRERDATIVIDHPTVSRRHFEITVREDGTFAADLGSSSGLFVNGVRVGHIRLKVGDELRAGLVLLTLESAAVEPIAVFVDVKPALDPTPPLLVEGTLLANLHAALTRTPLYAVVDGAQAFELAFAARLMGHRVYTLFTGDLAPTAAQFGPLLVALDGPSAFLLRWVEHLGKHPGVLLESGADLSTLYAHLRQIFIATDEEGAEYFFRFYDPRVLPIFLPTCRADELRDFFGPVTRWVVEGASEKKLSVYALENDRITCHDITGSV